MDWPLEAFIKFARKGAICLLPTRGGRYLMQDDSFGSSFKPKLRPPGGGKEPEDKTITDTIVREMHEEFGLPEADVRSRIEFLGYTPQKKYWGTPVYRLKRHGLKPGVYQASNSPDEKVKLVEVDPKHPNYTGPQPHKLITEEAKKLGDKLQKKGKSVKLKDGILPGGLADEKEKRPEDFPAKAVAKGMAVEEEHTTDKTLQKAIVADHLTEDPKTYDKAASIAVDESIKVAAANASALFRQVLGGRSAQVGQERLARLRLRQGRDPETGAQLSPEEFEARFGGSQAAADANTPMSQLMAKSAALFTEKELRERTRSEFVKANGRYPDSAMELCDWARERLDNICEEQEKSAKFCQPENFEEIKALSTRDYKVGAGANDWESTWTWATVTMGYNDDRKKRVWVQLDPPKEDLDGSKQSDWGKRVVNRWIAAAAAERQRRADEVDLERVSWSIEDFHRAADGLEGVKDFGLEEVTWREKQAAAMAPDASTETLAAIPKTGPEAIAWALQNVDLTKKESEAKQVLAKKLKSKRPDAIKMLGFLDGFKRSGLTPADLVMDKVPVIPPQFRPYTVAGDVFVPGDANELYRDLINLKDMHGELESRLGPAGAGFNKLNIYDAVKALYGYGSPTSPKTRERGVSGFLKKITGCHDDETEILTQKHGWVLFKNLPEDTKVATINPTTLAFEWQTPSAYQHFRYIGEMFHFQKKNRLDVLVTPAHDMWVRRRGKCQKADMVDRAYMRTKWGKEPAYKTASIAGTHSRFWLQTAACDWVGVFDRPEFVMGSDDAFAKLVGFWLAEGWFKRGKQAMLCQCPDTNLETCDEIRQAIIESGFQFTEEMLDRAPSGFNKNRSRQVRWRIHCESLGAWLFENCGHGSKTKYLSRTIKDWPAELLGHLFKSYLKGDGIKRPKAPSRNGGHTHKFRNAFTDSHASFSTSSQQLFSDWTEVGLKLGITIHRQRPVKKGYDSHMWRGAVIGRWNTISDSEVVAVVQYDGSVHCCTVANGLVVTRRNTFTFVSGNSNPKFSFAHRRLLGRNLDFVGRGVIAPDPDLGLDEIGLPEDMVWKMYSPYIQRRLVRGGMRLEDAVKAVEDRAGHASKMLDLELKDRPVVYNRDPSWHKFNAIGGYVKRVPGSTIMINPLVTTGQSGDFDGDQIGVHVPSLDDAVDDVREKLMPSKMLFSIKDPKKTVPNPKHEMIWSLHSAQNRPAKNTWNFGNEKEALAAIKSGKVSLSDEVKVGGMP